MLLIKLFWDICLFKKGPQDIPPSRLLLSFATAAYLLVGLALLMLENTSWDALLQLLAEFGMLIGFLGATLKAAGLTSRFLKSSIAMLGCDALISSFGVPLLAALMASSLGGAPFLLLILLMLWHLAVVAHILKNALSCQAWIGWGLAVVYILGSYQVMMLLFGPPPS